jgi:tetratricopeptide (TPR) repeat protein
MVTSTSSRGVSIALGLTACMTLGAWLGCATPDPGEETPNQLAETHFNRATKLLDLGKPDEAIAEFRAVLALNPENASAHAGKGAAYLQKNMARQALLDLNEALRIAANMPEALCLRARANLAVRRYSEATADARRALQLDANCAEALLTLADTALAMPRQDRDEASACLSEAVRISKVAKPPYGRDMARRFRDLSITFQDLKIAGDAGIALSEAMRLDRSCTVPAAKPTPPSQTATVAAKVAAQLIAAQSLLEGLSHGPALAAFGEILKENPTNIDAWLGRGSALLGKRQWDAAIRSCDQAIGIDPRCAEAYCLRAEAEFHKGDFYGARTDATTAIHLQPDYALAYFYHAEAAYEQRDYATALASLDEAVRLDRLAPKRHFVVTAEEGRLYVEIYRSEARQYAKDLEWDRAIDTLLAVDQKLIKSHLIRRQEVDKAAAQLVETYRDRAKAQLRGREWDAAIDGLTQAIAKDHELAGKLNPLVAQAHAERGYARVRRSQFTGGVADIQQAFTLDEHSAQVYRLAALASRIMAKYCHQRQLAAQERGHLEAASKALGQAIRFDPEMETELNDILEDCQRQLDRSAEPAVVTLL